MILTQKPVFLASKAKKNPMGFIGLKDSRLKPG
jgi:hypothetical protein